MTDQPGTPPVPPETLRAHREWIDYRARRAEQRILEIVTMFEHETGAGVDSISIERVPTATLGDPERGSLLNRCRLDWTL